MPSLNNVERELLIEFVASETLDSIVDDPIMVRAESDARNRVAQIIVNKLEERGVNPESEEGRDLTALVLKACVGESCPEQVNKCCTPKFSFRYFAYLCNAY